MIKNIWHKMLFWYHSTKGFYPLVISMAALIISFVSIVIMSQDLKLTHRSFLEIRPINFYQDSAWKGEDKTQVWCHFDFEIANHGNTPVYDIKIDKLDVILDRKIDLLKVLESDFGHICIFPNKPIVITLTVTNSKVDTQKILDAKKYIEYDIKVRYRGPIKSDYYWYNFKAKINIKNQLIYSYIEGN